MLLQSFQLVHKELFTLVFDLSVPECFAADLLCFSCSTELFPGQHLKWEAILRCYLQFAVFLIKIECQR